jgi:hypothetical protein
MFKLTLKFLAIGILTGCLIFFVANGRYSSIQPEAPRIIATKQSDSPLLITPTYVDASKPLSPHYGYLLLNISEKPIRAYTIQYTVSLGDGGLITSHSLANSPSESSFLKSKESRQEDEGEGKTYQAPPIQIELAVDFVEFADGTRWGKDINQSSNRLDGMRMGGRAAIKKLREILAKQGMEGLDKALTAQTLISPEPTTQSDIWINGFMTGVNMVKSRIEAAKFSNGEDGVKRELSMPFDATEGRQNQ